METVGTTPVTPTTPTAFETRNTGVTLEVEPVVGPDGVTIDLNLVPQVVEFEGFINYGSPDSIAIKFYPEHSDWRYHYLACLSHYSQRY